MSDTEQVATLAGRGSRQAFVADVVLAYLQAHPVPAAELPRLIAAVASGLDAGVPTSGPQPAVDPKKSVFPDRIVCLEDGKVFKSMRGHLRRIYGLTPEQYRKKWNLPYDYPVVAPDYSATRSKMAASIGLGRRK